MKKAFILSLLGIAVIATSASAEIKFVNSDSEYEEINTSSATTLTLSGFDAGKAADTYIVISVASKLKEDDDNPISSVSFNGTPVPSAASEYVNDSYEGWANLYIAPVSGVGDIEVNYLAPTDDEFDAISISVASYSSVKGIGATSRGANDPGGPTELSDSISTTGADSLIVSSLMAAGNSKGSMDGMGDTMVRVDNTEKRLNNGLLETKAPKAGRYSPGADFPGQLRASIVSAELLAK